MTTLNTERNKHVTENLLKYGSVLFWGMVLIWSYTQLMGRAEFGIIFLGSTLLLYILNELLDVLEEEDMLSLVLLLICAAIIVPVVAYMFDNYQLLYVDQTGTATDLQLGGALAFTLVMIYLTWRSFGITFVAVLLVGILYGLYGNYIPGLLGHGGITYERMLRVLVVSVEGFFGFLNRLTAAWIAPFMLYAGLIRAYGAFDLILRLAVRSAKYLSSGVAQTAVIASGVIGSVNGSQTANAGMTGSFTIPMMKKNGVKPATAGAIEAVASTSGQVLPPVMGAAAFIMPTLMEDPLITYFTIIQAGLIPAAILVLTIFVAVHYVASPQIEDPEMEGYFEDTLPPKQMAIDLAKFAIPLVILIYMLGPAGYTVQTGALWTALSMIVLGVTVPIVQEGFQTGNVGEVGSTAKGVLFETADGFKQGAIVLAPIAIILSAINGVVDILLTTGTPTSISLALLDLSGGVLIIAGLLAMAICILLGLGMPTTAAYTIVALLVAPSLISNFALPELSAHFFVFYAAILAGLTPPIATCVAVTTGIAGSNFWRTAAEAIKISAPLFVLPFVFLYHPEMVAAEFTTAAFVSGGLAMGGSLTIIHGLAYQFSFGRVETLLARGIFFALGVTAMVHPSRMFQGGALAVAVGLYVVQSLIGRPSLFGNLQRLGTGINGRFR